MQQKRTVKSDLTEHLGHWSHGHQRLVYQWATLNDRVETVDWIGSVDHSAHSAVGFDQRVRACKGETISFRVQWNFERKAPLG